MTRVAPNARRAAALPPLLLLAVLLSLFLAAEPVRAQDVDAKHQQQRIHRRAADRILQRSFGVPTSSSSRALEPLLEARDLGQSFFSASQQMCVVKSVTSWTNPLAANKPVGMVPFVDSLPPSQGANPVDHAWLRTEIEAGVRVMRDQTGAVSAGDVLDRRASQAQRQQPDADLAKLVNPFIGTGATSNPGNVFPGASVPFGMAKSGVDCDTYAPAGYNDDLAAPIRGLSLVHDSGTGSSSGSFGLFESMPVVCKGDDFSACTTSLDARKRNRTEGQDRARPGYFTTTLNNGIKMETTSTRRAGLVRYTYPRDTLSKGGGSQPFVVFDWTNDLPGSFRGGEASFDPNSGRIMLNGSFTSSFGSSVYMYRAFACYDVLNEGKQKLGKSGAWQANRFGVDAKVEGRYKLRLNRDNLNTPLQTGFLASFSQQPSDSNGAATVTLRFGVSYQSAEQACRNAEAEVPQWDLAKVESQSRSLWNEKLNRYQIDAKTNATIAELLYSSLYRSWLSPNNATGEGPLPTYSDSRFWFDGLYVGLGRSARGTWDTFRTFYPLLSLSSTADYASIAYTYVDTFKREGYVPECRANLVPGLTQGGSNGVNVLADFAVKYKPYGLDAKLGVTADDIYAAIRNDGLVTPPEWNSYGRQIDSYTKYGYVPFDELRGDGPIGRATREASRTLECESHFDHSATPLVCATLHAGTRFARLTGLALFPPVEFICRCIPTDSFNDFGICQTAALLGKKEDVKRFCDRALWYRNVYNPAAQSLGTKGFVGKRRPDGSFLENNDTDPIACSPIDTVQRSCSLQEDTKTGTYETSRWEYTLFAPQDVAGLVKQLGGNDAFERRVDTFFDKGLFYSGNEPSFQSVILYHYINKPARSVERVRELVFKDFNTTNGGLPGNDDNAAMATLLSFHLLGLYPVPSSQEYLIVSPFLPSYTVRNEALGSFTVRATNFDPATLARKIPAGARAYVEAVYVNGKKQSSNCKIQYNTLLPGGGAHTDVELRMTADRNVRCGQDDSALPSSLSTGGFLAKRASGASVVLKGDPAAAA